MLAAPQGLVPLAVTETAAPTAAEAVPALTPVTVPADARPIPVREMTRNAAIDLMWGDRSKRQAVPGSAGSGLLGAGRAGLQVHFLLCSVDAAPVLVLGDRHPAFDTDPDPRLGGVGLLREQLLKEAHRFSDGRTGAEVCKKDGFVNFSHPIP